MFDDALNGDITQLKHGHCCLVSVRLRAGSIAPDLRRLPVWNLLLLRVASVILIKIVAWVHRYCARSGERTLEGL
jgi:hypothetical protein